MTLTNASSALPPSDSSALHGHPEKEEQPGTIPWDHLSAHDYRSALEDLGSWLAWLVPAYRIPPSVIPPCWFLHNGVIEELGHLWTGWRVTRHSESGVGMVGLEWDNHRERVTGRLRELVATAGCNGMNHSSKPGPLLNRDDRLWEANLQAETEIRTGRSTERAILSAARDVLLKAEQRNELALDILSDIAADPAHPTDAEISQCSIALDTSTRAAAADALRRSQEASTHLGNATSDAFLTIELAAARQDLLARMAAGCAPGEFEAASRRWMAAMARAAPAGQALRRAAATNAGVSAAANNLASTKFRHDGIRGLLPSTTTAWGPNA